MNFAWTQLLNFAWPQLLLLVGAFACLLIGIIPSKRAFRANSLLAIVVFLAAGYGFWLQWQDPNTHSIEVLLFDSMGSFLNILICLIGAITLVFSIRYWESLPEPIAEVIALILFAAFGMSLMVSTTHLLTLVLGLEVMSLCLYVLVGTRRLDPKASEAAFKYFLLGSVAAAFMLFGISFLYGATGSIEMQEMLRVIIAPDKALIFKMGVLLLFLGLAFKVAAVPFHFWAPDVYDGAPVPVTGFMAAGVKVAAFGALLRILQVFSTWDALSLSSLLVVLAIATMIIGNLTALRQRSLKRILAYSSIAHAGYLLLGLAALTAGNEFNEDALSPILFYLAVYGLLTLGIFALLTLFSSRGREINDLSDLQGIASQHPVFAAALSIFLISLAGVPPGAGFFAKYYLFSEVIDVGFYGAAIVGILTSAISLYYYLGPVVRMFFQDPVGEVQLPIPGPGVKLLIILLIFGVLYLGLFPGKVLQMTKKSMPQLSQQVTLGH